MARFSTSTRPATSFLGTSVQFTSVGSHSLLRLRAPDNLAKVRQLAWQPTTERLRADLLAQDTPAARAAFLYEVNRLIYDTVKKVYADHGFADTPERTGLGKVTDEADRHRIDMFTATHGSHPRLPHRNAALEELEQWRADPTEAHQKAVSQPMPGDDKLVELTVYEAEKCSAMIYAFTDGLELYRSLATDVATLLSYRAIEASGAGRASRDPWDNIGPAPWPPPKGLRDDNPDQQR